MKKSGDNEIKVPLQMHGYDGYSEPNRIWYHIDHIYKLKNGLYTPPVMVEISPTSNCNHECRFCYTYQREEANMLSGKALVGFFLNATDIGIKTIFIQGIGEPLLNKSLPDAIVAGGESDIKMCLVTNGVLLDKSKQEKILNNLVFVKFSVLDNDPKRYAKTHGCPENQFNKLVENIENAIDFRSMNNLDVTLWASVYVDIDNFSDIYDIVKFSKSLGLDFVTISQATYTEFTPHGRKEILVDDSFSKEEIDELIEKILSLNDDKFVSHIQFPLERYFSSKRWGLNYCRAVNLITAISGDGEVYPCWRFWGRREYSYGSLYEKSFEEIWRGKRRKEINEYLYATPPEKDECEVCKCITVNDNLDKLLNNHNKWTDIL